MWSTTDPRCFEDNQYVPWYGCACAYWSPINVFFLWCDCVNWAHINEMSFVKKSYKRESAKTHAYKVIIWLCARQRVNYHYDFHSQSSNINRLKMQRIWAKHTKTLYRRLIWGIVELKNTPSIRFHGISNDRFEWNRRQSIHIIIQSPAYFSCNTIRSPPSSHCLFLLCAKNRCDLTLSWIWSLIRLPIHSDG